LCVYLSEALGVRVGRGPRGGTLRLGGRQPPGLRLVGPRTAGRVGKVGGAGVRRPGRRQTRRPPLHSRRTLRLPTDAKQHRDNFN